jgi:hypothetical protein
VKRPISITLVALWLLLGAALDLHSLLSGPLRFHFFNVLGLRLLHYSAAVAYLVDIQLRVFIGIGLLDLRRSARVAGIIFCAYSAVNAMVAFFQPGSLAAFIAAVAAPAERFRFNADTLLVLREAHAASLVVAVGVSLLALYFLVARRAPFYPQVDAFAPAAAGAASSAAQPNSAAPALTDSGSSAAQQSSAASASAPPAGQGSAS